MMLSLSARMEELIRSKVRSGNFDSPGQVVEEALLLLEERDHLNAIRKERLVRELASGVFQANNRHLIGSVEVLASLSHQKSLPDE